ncbi:hypothetical protein LZ32DRAFT_602051 [Colletotrichum eremochloae]|nr:hypothetical protein LZ32DRAFT_602051 [Colletotrichum eremochloae]
MLVLHLIAIFTATTLPPHVSTLLRIIISLHFHLNVEKEAKERKKEKTPHTHPSRPFPSQLLVSQSPPTTAVSVSIPTLCTPSSLSAEIIPSVAIASFQLPIYLPT